MGSAPFGGRVTLPDHGRLGRRDPKGATHDLDAAGVLNDQQPGRADGDAEEQGGERPHVWFAAGARAADAARSDWRNPRGSYRVLAQGSYFWSGRRSSEDL
jgi:hypothetical protein